MVLRSKQKEAPVGRRMRLTAQNSRQSHPAKQQQYQVSNSDDSGAGSDKVSTAQGSMPAEANVIGTIASCLQGSAAMDILLKSQFGKLFELPVARCHNSTKLIGNLLCRQLVTIRKFELWFIVATHPLRFSLDEFRDVIGLNCRAFNVYDSETDDATGSTMWNQLFDTTLGDITVSHVLEMLRNPYLADWKMVPLALIALWMGLSAAVTKPLNSTLNPLQAMRVRLSQQTTTCYGFPLALQFAFQCLPLLLSKIPDASRNATFLDDPTACASTVTILTVQDIEKVETDPALSVHFDLIPDGERHLWLEEVEDGQVTSLVEMIRSEQTFKFEDFPGGDRSFGPRPEEKENNGHLPKDEKCGPLPVHQRNLRPRKPVHVNIEELSSSGDSEPHGPPRSRRCTHEDLKPWLLVQLEKLLNALSKELKDQLGQMEINICRRLGMPEDTIHNSRKRKGSDDHRRQSASPESGGLQTQRPIYRGKKTKPVVSKPGEKKNMRIRCGVETETTYQKWEPKKTAQRYLRERQATKTRNAYTQWSGGCSSTRNTRALQSLCILMLYVFVFSPMCHHQRSLEPGVSEIKNSYKSRGNQTLISTDAQEPVSLNVCTEKFPYAAVDVGVRHVPIVEESNPECPTMEEDEKYDSCREDMSTDSYMQEKRGNPVSDTKEDSIYVASGGKRQRKISSKIRGVYTPDARLKGIFKIKTGYLVTNSFLLDMANPGKWLSDELELGCDVEIVCAPMNWGGDHWVGLSINLQTSHATIFDSYIPHSETAPEVDAHMAPVLSSLLYTPSVSI
ncbi:hypothetical protein Bca4012_020024 [Brassica carinata]